MEKEATENVGTESLDADATNKNELSNTPKESESSDQTENDISIENPPKPITMKNLLEAGVHFGHQRKRWNPKMKKYIFGERNGIHIIDLQQTLRLTKDVAKFAIELGLSGGKILFVGTKKQAQETIINGANKAGAFYVTNRWLGGTLTNFETIKSRISDLNKLENNKSQNQIESKSIFELTKRETQKIEKNLSRLQKHFGGIKDMKKVPDALFVIDIAKEDIAIKEAVKLNIPIIALVDTDGDPTPIEHIIPGNDDAIRSIQLATSLIADNYVYGYQLRLQKLAEIAKQQELEKAQKQKMISEKEKVNNDVNTKKTETAKSEKPSENKKTTPKTDTDKPKTTKPKQTKKPSENKKTTPKTKNDN